MSRSYTKHPFPCTHFCKKGNSKKGKILANKKFRRVINRSEIEPFGKSNYYKRFTKWWNIQGDYGFRPYSLNKYIKDYEALAKRFNEKFDFNKTVNEWKKYFYRK